MGEDQSAQAGSLLANLPESLPDERIDSLLDRAGVRIERIVSTGHVTPAGAWYDQEWDEWVLVVQGAGHVQIAGEPEPRVLGAGDWLFLPAHLRHRVTWTDPDVPTVWLAVHVAPEDQVRGSGPGP